MSGVIDSPVMRQIGEDRDGRVWRLAGLGWLIAFVVALLLVWMVAFHVGPFGLGSATEAHLYDSWVQTMIQVGDMTKGPYPATKYDRLRLVAQVDAQNERAAGMAFILQSNVPVQSSVLTQLSGGLMSVNIAISDMLNVMESGYTGSASSQLAPSDIRFIHRLIVQRVLGRLPGTLHSELQVEQLVPRINAISSYLTTLGPSHFSEPQPTPTIPGY